MYAVKLRRTFASRRVHGTSSCLRTDRPRDRNRIASLRVVCNREPNVANHDLKVHVQQYSERTWDGRRMIRWKPLG